MLLDDHQALVKSYRRTKEQMVQITHSAANRPMISQLKSYLHINLLNHSLTDLEWRWHAGALWHKWQSKSCRFAT